MDSIRLPLVWNRPPKNRITKFIAIVFICVVLIPAFAHAQANVSLKEVLQFVEKNYPALKAKMLEAESSRQNIRLAKSTLIPSLDLSYQFNYSTYNNITGMFYPTDLLPISGPPSTGNNYSGVIGSAGSVYMNWQPITFGKRTAQVNLAKAGANVKTFDLEREVFVHQLKLAGAYLDLLVENEMVAVYRENLERSNFNLELSRTLTISGMRPGVDTALFSSEVSGARIQLLNAQNAASTMAIIVSQLIGSDSIKILPDTLFFHQLPVGSNTDANHSNHPFYKQLLSEMDFEKKKQKTIGFDAVPKLGFWGIAYGRGSGAGYSSSEEASQGFRFSRYNYGTGLQLTLPILHLPEVLMRTKQQSYLVKAADEKVKQADLDLRKEQEIADTVFSNALKEVKEASVQQISAGYAFDAMQSRYKAGLSNYADFIQAQYNLVRSETELKKAYWMTWKALLNKAEAQGDLKLFMNLLK